jgi:hypothetical protein
MGKRGGLREGWAVCETLIRVIPKGDAANDMFVETAAPLYL